MKDGLTGLPECKDDPIYENNCPTWKYDCFHDDYEAFMKVACQKTCGFCGM